ncbi:MAG TPA: gamma-glutamyltransferase, partial [Burkholderiales bacterium]|nr:gamma-glutamyltransferase [Burkholderiales bacterium]
MVACPHALASAAGVDALRAGGSAVDAALAAAGVLAVVYPHMCGVGGDAFWLIYDARRGKVDYLEGGGRAAANGSLDFFQQKDLAEIPFRGILPATLTTPGAVASWCEAHARYGKLPLSKDLERAIGYAREGYPASERLARWIALTAAELGGDPGCRSLFLPGGESPRENSLLANPALARTLEAIAAQGREGFYEGEVAKALGRFSREHGGFFTARDLAAQEATWGEPLRGGYRGVTICETPAPTQGFTVLEMLNLVEPFELAKKPWLGPDHLHLLVQAKQIAYHDRDRVLADPRFADVPLERLVSKEHASRRRS